MKAYGFNSANTQAQLFEHSIQDATGYDLLVKIDAIAVNPVDIKVISCINARLDAPKIVGWDACGVVIAVGESVEQFKAGDKVFYAGDVKRAGCYASHQLVDERIVGHAPKSLSASEAAAMPLTSITAWEALFSRLKISADHDAGKSILIIGGAGGVGSIAIQLAKKVAKLNVITTASRTESEQWCKDRGADHIINHHSDLVLQYRALGISDPDYILCLNNTDKHYDAMAELVAPQGMICSIVGTQEKHDLDCLKSKSAGFVWEFMFTRPMFKTPDIAVQQQILNTLSELIDDGQINTTLTEIIGAINSDNITKAHQQLLSNTTIGKLVLTAIEE